MKAFRNLIVAVVLGLLATSCYTPASSNWYSYSANFFGRKTLVDRSMSTGFALVTLPVYAGALVIDIPFAVIEFFIGWKPFKDPALGFLDDGELPHYEVDSNGDLWTMDRDYSDPSALLITQERDSLILKAFRAETIETGEIRLARLICADDMNPKSCN